MARRLAKVCPQPGCPNLQPCELHAPKPWAGSDRASRLPANWQAIRRQVLRRDRHTCQACHGERCGNQRLEVDHIDRGDDHSLANLQTLGHDCHLAKSLHEATQARAGGGPPPPG